MSITLEHLMQSAGVERLEENPALMPLLTDDLVPAEEAGSEADRLASALAAFLMNIEPTPTRFDKAKLSELTQKLDKLIDLQLNEVIHAPAFQELEATWRGLEDLVKNTNFRKNVAIDLLDVSKKELGEDFENNSVDIFQGALFEKIYIHEYDQYGGKPFGAMIGLYEFVHTPADEEWLGTMARIANAAHAPFIASVSPKFFGAETMEELEAIKDVEGLMAQPAYGSWNAFREREEAAYIGLTFPRYILRLPWHPTTNPCEDVNFTEAVLGEQEKYLWGSSAILFARNMVRSFEGSGWCQYLRGPKGGGLVSGLPVHAFEVKGVEDIRIPVETTVPDYWELAFAKSGFIPLVYRKSTADATFFSAQSIKKPLRFKDPRDSENSQLVTNLSYTFSITRIAHYVKSIMRDNIGSSADAAYIQRVLETWLLKYITVVSNPDDLTLRYYPFKACEVEVTARDGEIGWYDCFISVLPHVQFEGMDVELRLESRLG